MKRTLIAAVLSLALVFAFGAASSTFAANEGTDASQANLVKYLKLADGVTDPNVAFTFHFTSNSQGAPAIEDQTITPAATSESELDGGSLVGSKALNSFMPTFSHAGVYKYTVTETAKAAGFTNGEKETTQEDGTVIKEKITFSTESYTMEVRVANDGNGGVKEPVISIEKDGTGEGEHGVKVDPTDNDPTVTQEPSEEGGDPENVDHGGDATIPGFSFTNVYEKSTKKPVNPDPTDPTQGKYGAAGITKTVSGQYGDQTFAFPFTLTMTAGTGVSATEATAHIYTGKEEGEAVTVTFGEPTSFNLTHGQSLIFEELPDGVSYKVSENLQGCGVENEGSYTPSFNGAPGTKGASSVDNAITISDEEGAENDGHFINAIEDNDVTPTGIVISNLPYIILILIAVAGIAVFARKRRYQ